MRARRPVNNNMLPWFARKGRKKKAEGEESAAPKKKARRHVCVLSEPLAELCGESRVKFLLIFQLRSVAFSV